MKKTLVGVIANGRQLHLDVIDDWVDRAGQLGYIDASCDMSDPRITTISNDGKPIIQVTFRHVDIKEDVCDGDSEFGWWYNHEDEEWVLGFPSRVV